MSPKLREIPFNWAIKIAAIASYNAVPSMFTVAPTETTNRVTRASILLFSSRHLNVIGNAAAL